MWCPDCGQDVPGVVSLDHGQYRCPRCAAPGPSGADLRDAAPSLDNTIGGELLDSEPLFDSWEMDERLRHIERVLQAGALKGGNLKLHGGHSCPNRPHFTMLRRHRRRNGPPPADGVATALYLVGMFFFSVGLVGLTCGLALLGWSAFGARSDLWNTGMTVTLAGQSGLLLGALAHLKRLRRNPRPPADEMTFPRLPEWGDDSDSDWDRLDDPLAA